MGTTRPAADSIKTDIRSEGGLVAMEEEAWNWNRENRLGSQSGEHVMGPVHEAPWREPDLDFPVFDL